ncbi:MAG: hypothetical protein ABJK28_12620 [Algibacter sp.]
MKITFRIFVLLFILFIQNGFSQKNKNWKEAAVFIKTDTIAGFINSNSISFDGIKFRKDINAFTEFLTPELINGFDVNGNIYETVFIKSFGTFGEYKFGKLMLMGRFNLYQTATTNYSAMQTPTRDVYILNFNDKIVKISLNVFNKIKNKKKVAKELAGCDQLQNIILKKEFDFNTFFDEVKKLNSKK